MKEASGELSMTVITIIAVSLILGLIYFMWPKLRNSINDSFDTAAKTSCVNDAGSLVDCSK